MKTRFFNTIKNNEKKFLLGAFGLLALYGISNKTSKYLIERKHFKNCKIKRD